MKGVQQSKLSSILFEERVIKVCELQFDAGRIKGVVLPLPILPHFFLRMEHWGEGLHVSSTPFRVLKDVSGRRFGFKIDGSRVIESRFLDGFALDPKLAEAMRILGGVAIFSDSWVTDWSVGWVLPDCFKHWQINLTISIESIMREQK